MVNPTIRQLASDENAPVAKFQFSSYQVNKLYHNNNDVIDFVTNGKSLYVCIVDNTVTSHTNIEDEPGFLKIISQGAQGNPGVKGDDGKPGTTPSLTFKFVDRRLLISENGVVKAASPDLSGQAWRPVLRGDELDWELSKDKTTPQSINLHDLTAPERPILLRTNSDNTKRDDETSGPANFIQWKYEGDAEWTNLISISELINLALAGVSFWPDNEGYWHFGHKEVINATYSSDDSGREIISNVELGDVLFDAGKIPFANYELDINNIKERLAVLESKPDVNLNNYYTKPQSDARFQPLGNYLTSHQPLKTINGESLIGSGNIRIEGGSGETPDLDGYATEDWVNNQKFVKKVNNIAPDANGNITLSIVGNPIVSIKIENNKLYKKNANDTGWIEIGPVGIDGGSGLTEAQVKTLIGRALEGLDIPSEYVRDGNNNYFIRLNDLTVALGNYYTKSQVYTKGQVDALISGDANTYRTFMIFKRSANPNSETLPTTTITWNISTGILDIPEGSNGWTEHPENATSAAPYLWMASATFESLTGERTGDWDGPFCMTGERGGEGYDGDGIEFIYHLGASAPSINYTKAYKSGETTKSNVQKSWWATSESRDWLPGDGTTDGHWTDDPTGIDDANVNVKIEWASVRTYDGINKTWSDFSNPFRWAMWGEDGVDGAGVEYIFYVAAEDMVTRDTTTGKATLNSIAYVGKIPRSDIEVNNLGESYQIDDWCPDGTVRSGIQMPNYGWTDNPSDVDAQQPYEFVCIRKYNGTTGKWGKFSDPKLWGYYGTTTIRVTEYGNTNYKPYTCYAFYRTNTNISTYRVLYDFRSLDSSYTVNTTFDQLTESQKIQFYENPLQFIRTVDSENVEQPIAWQDTVPFDSKEQLWLITAHIGDEAQSTDTGWTSPVKWGDQSGLQIEYAVSSEATDNVYNKVSGYTLPNLSTKVNNIPKYETDDPTKDLDGDGIDETTWRADVLNGGMGVWGDENDIDDPDYMAICFKRDNGTWTDWQISRIKGEKGDKGDSNYYIDANQELFTFSANENGLLVEPVDPVNCKYTLKYGKASIPDSEVTWAIHRTDEFVIWDGRTSSTQKKITYTGIQVSTDEAPRSDCLYKWIDSEGNNFYTNTLALNSTSRIFDANQNQWTYYGTPSNVTGLSISNGTLYGTLSNFLKDQVLIDVSATHAGVTTNKIITFQKIRQGATGPKGVSGVPYFFRGNWETDTDYYCNAQRIDIVKNGDHYYICQQQNGEDGHTSNPNNEPTWNDSLNRMNENPYWVAFEGEFTNIATDFIFARQALIDRLELNFADVNGVLCANRIVANSNCTGESQSGDESLIDYIDRKSSEVSDVVVNLSNDYQQIQLYDDGDNGVMYEQSVTTNVYLYKGTDLLAVDDIEYDNNGTWTSITNSTGISIYDGTLKKYLVNGSASVEFTIGEGITFAGRKVIPLRVKRTQDGNTYYGYADWVLEGTTKAVYHLNAGAITQLIIDDNNEVINSYDGTSTSSTYHSTACDLENQIDRNVVLDPNKYILFFKWNDEESGHVIAKGANDKYIIRFKTTGSITGDTYTIIHKNQEGSDSIPGWADGNHKSYTVYAYVAEFPNNVLNTNWTHYVNDGFILDYQVIPVLRNSDVYTLDCNYSVIPMAEDKMTPTISDSITAGVYKNGNLMADALITGTAYYYLTADATTSVSQATFTSINGLLTISSSDIVNASQGDYFRRLEITTTYNNTALHTTVGVVYNGSAGANAVPYTYQGEWEANKQYVKNNQQVDVVKYNDVWYMCKTFHTSGSTFDSSNWTAFVGNFENIATGLLFAEEVYSPYLRVDNANIDGKISADKIEVVNELSTLTDTGKGIVIGNNNLHAYSSYGSDCVHITGDAIEDNTNQNIYYINAVTDENQFHATSANNLTPAHYIDLLDFTRSAGSEIRINPITFDLTINSNANSGIYRLILRKATWNSSGDLEWTDYELINSQHMFTSSELDGNSHQYTTNLATITGDQYGSGLYRLSIKLEVNFPRSRWYGKVFKSYATSTVVVGRSTQTITQIGSNGAIFNFGSEGKVTFLNNNNSPELILTVGAFGIKIDNAGIYRKNGQNWEIWS